MRFGSWGVCRRDTVRIDSRQRSRSRINRRSSLNATGLFSDHYGLQGHKTQAESPNENGDVEQRHYRFKKAVEQSLMLRGSCDFASRQDYAVFLDKLFVQLNAGRLDRFKEESEVLRRLPPRRLDSCKKLGVRVGPSSTIRVKHNVYSVDSRLIGEEIQVRLYAEHLEIWYAQRCLETMPRLRGEGKHRIQYRHIIDWLVRKPGAFENYRYREELFPTHRFRMAYDGLRRRHPSRAAKEYLEILHLAARENEAAVDDALRTLLDKELPISLEAVERIVGCQGRIPWPVQIVVAEVDLAAYDALLRSKEVLAMLSSELKPSLVRCLKELHLPTVRACYGQEADRARQESLTYEHYLAEVMEREREVRRQNRIQRLLRESKLPLEKSLEAFEMSRLSSMLAAQAQRPAGRFLCGALRECPGLWQSGKWKNPPALRHRSGTDPPTRSPIALRSLQPSGAAVARCEARPEAAPVPEGSFKV